MMLIMLLWLIVVAALDVFSCYTLYLHLEVGMMMGQGGQDQLHWILCLCWFFDKNLRSHTSKKNKIFNLLFLQILKKNILFLMGWGRANLFFIPKQFYYIRDASPKQRIISIWLIVIVICKNILLSLHCTILPKLQNFKNVQN